MEVKHGRLTLLQVAEHGLCRREMRDRIVVLLRSAPRPVLCARRSLILVPAGVDRAQVEPNLEATLPR